MHEFITFKNDIELALSAHPELLAMWEPLKNITFAPKLSCECTEDELNERMLKLDAANIDTVVDSFWSYDFIGKLLNEMTVRLALKPNSIFRFYQFFSDEELQDFSHVVPYLDSTMRLFKKQTGLADITSPFAPKLIAGYKSPYFALVFDEFKEEEMEGQKVSVIDIALWDLAIC